MLIGVSGSGKSTIANMLCQDYGFQETVSHTTRQKREGEIDQFEAKEGDKISYYFVTNDQFEGMVKRGEFIEDVSFGGNRYGVHSSQVLSNDKVVLVVEPNGAKQISEWAKKRKDVKVSSFYLDVSPEEQFNRMLKRGDDIDSINKRLSMDDIKERSKELFFTASFDTNVINATYISAFINLVVEE